MRQYFTKSQFYISSPFCVCVCWFVYQRERYRLPRKLNSLPHHNIYNTRTHSLYIFLIEKPCKMLLIWRRRDGASALVFQVLGFTHHARSSSQNVREILYLNKANGGGSECCVLYLLRREYCRSVCLHMRCRVKFSLDASYENLIFRGKELYKA